MPPDDPAPSPEATTSGRAVAAALVVVLTGVVVAGGVWAVSARRVTLSREVAARLAEDPPALQVRRRAAVAEALAALAGATADDPRARAVEQALRAPRRAPATRADPLVLPPRDHPDFDEASRRELAAAETALASRPDDASALGRLGEVRAARGDPVGAFEVAARALDLSPTAWQGWLARGRARQAQGDLARARVDLLVAEALCDDDPTRILLARADVAEAEGDLDLARALLTLARDAGQVPAAFGLRQALDARLARLVAGR